jgi:nitrogen regulatory protein P-II 1
MKKIEAIIRPEALEAVKRALIDVDVNGMHAENVIGHGHQGGVKLSGRGGQPYTVDMLPKVKLTIVVSTEDWMNRAVDAIIANARTGNIGDGKIFVSEVEDAIRVRTGESGDDVL